MKSMSPLFFVVGVFGIVSVTPAGANGFLKASTNEGNERLSQADVRAGLLSEVEGALGAGSASQRVTQMTDALRPIFVAMPKNQHGNLEHNTTRHALHRLFVLRHGWVIKGLNLGENAWNASSPADILTDQVPSYIQDLCEKRLHGKGLGLHELAVLAATIEHLIHNEAVGKMGDVYNLNGLLPTDMIDASDADDLLDTYMMGYILGKNFANMTGGDARSLKKMMPEIFVGWKETQQFVRGIRASTARGSLDFATLSKVVATVGEQFGSFQDGECAELKATLMKMETQGTGRVKLSDFYKPARDGQWQFMENIDYLRQLGVIDEFDKKNPSVIIPNYLASQANCIAASGFYSICCKDECESLVGHLEQHIAAPQEKPAIIAAIVASLPSSTVKAPRTLAPNLIRRLDDIALGHGGVVPLHGRLFRQWLHHAYPLECRFPHMSGTTMAQSAEEWEIEHGVESTATKEEMAKYISNLDSSSNRIGDQVVDSGVAPWSFDEELLVAEAPKGTWESVASVPAAIRSIVLLVASGSLAFTIIQSFKGSRAFGKTADLKMV